MILSKIYIRATILEILFSTLAAEVHLSVNAFDPSRAIAETTSLGIVALCRGVDFEEWAREVGAAPRPDPGPVKVHISPLLITQQTSTK